MLIRKQIVLEKKKKHKKTRVVILCTEYLHIHDQCSISLNFYLVVGCSLNTQ
jgi:hypothetical protein